MRKKDAERAAEDKDWAAAARPGPQDHNEACEAGLQNDEQWVRAFCNGAADKLHLYKIAAFCFSFGRSAKILEHDR